jgi:septum formation protein
LSEVFLSCVAAALLGSADDCHGSALRRSAATPLSFSKLLSLARARGYSSRVKSQLVILASASPRRKQLLCRMGVKFRAIAANVDERRRSRLSPRELATRLALAKARAVARRFPDAVVIGADTIVTLNGKLFEKPRDLKQAARMLGQLQGKTHRVITGVCVLHLREKKKALFAETTKVTFRKMTSQQIREYLRLINPLDKAGAYAAQEHTDCIIARVEGSFSNVVGLPSETLGALLVGFGLKVATANKSRAGIRGVTASLSPTRR